MTNGRARTMPVASQVSCPDGVPTGHRRRSLPDQRLGGRRTRSKGPCESCAVVWWGGVRQVMQVLMHLEIHETTNQPGSPESAIESAKLAATGRLMIASMLLKMMGYNSQSRFRTHKGTQTQNGAGPAILGTGDAVASGDVRCTDLLRALKTRYSNCKCTVYIMDV